jgi:hypothetical protein
VSLSGFGMSAKLASSNEFGSGSIPSLSISWKSLSSVGIF